MKLVHLKSDRDRDQGGQPDFLKFRGKSGRVGIGLDLSQIPSIYPDLPQFIPIYPKFPQFIPTFVLKIRVNWTKKSG